MADKIHVYQDKAAGHEWRWNRVAPNGEKVSESGDGMSFEHAVDAARREAEGTDAEIVIDK